MLQQSVQRKPKERNLRFFLTVALNKLFYFLFFFVVIVVVGFRLCCRAAVVHSEKIIIEMNIFAARPKGRYLVMFSRIYTKEELLFAG